MFTTLFVQIKILLIYLKIFRNTPSFVLQIRPLHLCISSWMHSHERKEVWWLWCQKRIYHAEKKICLLISKWNYENLSENVLASRKMRRAGRMYTSSLLHWNAHLFFFQKLAYLTDQRLKCHLILINYNNEWKLHTHISSRKTIINRKLI